MSGTLSYARLLRAAVRYFALRDGEELLAAAQRLSPPPDPVWEAMWRRNCSPLLVAGALIDAADRLGVVLPEAWHRRCVGLLEANARRYALMTELFVWLANSLACPVVRLKGMWLTEFIYPRVRGCPTRLFGDVDVAIPPESLSEAHRLLRAKETELQFHPEPWEYVYRLKSAVPTWEGLPMLENDKPVPAELLEWGNHSLFVEVHTGSLELMRFVKKPFLVAEEGNVASHVVHLSLHLLTHLFGHPMGWVDVALALWHPSFELGRFLSLVEEYRLERLWAVVMGVVAECFGEEIVPASFAPFAEGWLFRRARVVASERAAVEPVPMLWAGVELASAASPTWRGRAFVARMASQALLNALIPPETRFRCWIRPYRRRWLARRKAEPR